MRTRTAAAITATLLLAALTACSSDTTADPAACKAAMAKQMDAAAAAGDKAEQSKRPAACNGIDDKTAQRLAGEVMTEYLEGEKAAQDIQDDLDGIEAEIDDALGTEAP